MSDHQLLAVFESADKVADTMLVELAGLVQEHGAVGVYVGLMGFRAATTISRVAATKYFHGLMLLTVLIMISGVLRLVQARKDGFISGSEKMMMGAIILVGIPGMLWSFCVYQAGMFRAALIRTDLGT